MKEGEYISVTYDELSPVRQHKRGRWLMVHKYFGNADVAYIGYPNRVIKEQRAVS